MSKYFNLDSPAPWTSAKSWIMMNQDTGEVLFAKNEKEKRQIASLTKIMTLTVILDLIEKYKIDARNTYVEVLEISTTVVIGGTSADLLRGE
jgi:D-alanyl-D-alanine carboxypeptidase